MIKDKEKHKVLIAKEILSDKKVDRNIDFRLIYSSTTENIAGYSDLFDFSQKSYLTVGSSGDQALDAILHGAKNIDVVDICPFAKEYFYLKMAAVLVLSRVEFINFFGKYKYRNSDKIISDSFNINTYKRIHEAIADSNIKNFWNYLYNEYDANFLRNNLFSDQEAPISFISKVNCYLKDDAEYEKLRSLIRQTIVNFKIGNIFKTNINKKYDNINLSNLISYYSVSEIIQLCRILSNNLNEDGTMIMAYMYQGIDCNFKHIQLLQLAKEIFSGSFTKSFSSCATILDGCHSYPNDIALVYKKTKKI